MRFIFGNEHQLLPSKLKAGTTHEWTVFLRARHEPDNTSTTSAKKRIVGMEDVIEKVEFTLHPDFGVGPVRLFRAPFQVTRKGFGEFTVPVTITWKRHLKKEKTTIEHTLNFEGRITHTGFIAEFDNKLLFDSLSTSTKNGTNATIGNNHYHCTAVLALLLT
jgi:transcription initiation factor IIF auxiliary subunit